MIALLLAATAVISPALGTYTYAVDSLSGKLTSTIVLSARQGGIETHETLSSPNVQTDQEFDTQLRQLRYQATQAFTTLTIDVAPKSAVIAFGGNTAKIALDDAKCVLILDDLLTSSVLMPAVVRATDAQQCTLIGASSGQKVVAQIIPKPNAGRPPQAAAGDAVLAVRIGTVTEKIWYDPRTLIPDFLDFGNGASATLRTHTSAAPAR